VLVISNHASGSLWLPLGSPEWRDIGREEPAGFDHLRQRGIWGLPQGADNERAPVRCPCSRPDCDSEMKPALIILLCVAAVTGGVAWHFRKIAVAYRLTVEVRVNGETFTGSGVVATDWGRNANPLASAKWAFHDRGEAVTVDLGRHGLVFLTLRGRYFAWQLPMAVYGKLGGSEDLGTKIQELRQPGPIVEISHDVLPLLVRFRDTSDPNTAECVDPDNMAASFPPGTSVTLARATLATVDEPATTGLIEKQLPWLALPWPAMERLLTAAIWHWLPHPGQKTCLLLPHDLETTK
jgi:hypothetical protein